MYSIRKSTTGEGDDYTTDCLTGYSYYKEIHKLIAKDFREQQALDFDPKAIQ